MNNDIAPDPRPITEARLLSMVNASGDSFWETDVERRFINISDNMCRMMGFEREELRGRSVLDFMTPEYRAVIVQQAVARRGVDNPLANTSPLRHEGEFFRKDGSRLWIETVSVPVFDDAGAHIGYFGITRDVTERKHAERALLDAKMRLEMQLRHIHDLHEQMREHAIRDALTGLFNRRHFVDVAEGELDSARRRAAALSLVMLDVDHFKNVNDAYGHSTGDAALKAVGSLLSASTTTGNLVFRLGGEEFAILLTDIDHEIAIERAHAWRTALADIVIPVDGAAVRLTASFGVATYPMQAGGLAELMKVADSRMYRAKSLGRDRVVGQTDD